MVRPARLSIYEALKILTTEARRADVLKFMKEAYQSKSAHASAILQVSMAANKELFKKIEEEGLMMGAFEEIFHKELTERDARCRNEGRLEIIKNLMETLKLSATEAMTAMKIPQAEQASYAALL